MNIEIKRLEWHTPPWSINLSRAVTIIGAYAVWTHHEANGRWFWRLENSIATDGECGSEEEARSACQSDYDARIRSALVEPKIKNDPDNYLTVGKVQAKIADERKAMLPIPTEAPVTVTEEMRVAACRALNERGKGNNVTICDVVAMLDAALSASPSPAVDSLDDRLVERRNLDHIWAKDLSDDELTAELGRVEARIANGFGEGSGSPGEWWYERADELDAEQKRRSALAAKEQQP